MCFMLGVYVGAASRVRLLEIRSNGRHTFKSPVAG